jgi:hypothetical protein
VEGVSAQDPLTSGHQNDRRRRALRNAFVIVHDEP